MANAVVRYLARGQAPEIYAMGRRDLNILSIQLINKE